MTDADKIWLAGICNEQTRKHSVRMFIKRTAELFLRNAVVSFPTDPVHQLAYSKDNRFKYFWTQIRQKETVKTKNKWNQMSLSNFPI